MLTFIAALIPIYIFWRVLTMPFRTDDGAEALGQVIGIVLFFSFVSWLIG